MIGPPDGGTSACIGGSVEDNTVHLKTLTVKTQPKGATTDGQDGVSCYGLGLEGAADVTLEDVVIEAGDGGDGGAVTGRVPSEEAVCRSKESEGMVFDAGYACSNGVMGTDGGHGKDAPRGGFTADGYRPARGMDGTPGRQGNEGTPPPAAPESGVCSAGCHQVDQGTCDTIVGTTVAFDASCGCGGRGGPAGIGGRGGGASVALFVSSPEARVSVMNSELIANRGGRGSPGLDGVSGDPGSTGQAGPTVQCAGCQSSTGVDCASYGETCECPATQYSLTGVPAGGPGGRGGKGGRGGGGSGGPSVAVVVPFGWDLDGHGSDPRDNPFVLDPDDTRLITSSPGWGADGAADGYASSVMRLDAEETPEDGIVGTAGAAGSAGTAGAQ